MYVHLCICVYICMNMCMYTCMYTCVCMYVYIYVPVYMPLYNCVYVCVLVCIPVYTRASRFKNINGGGKVKQNASRRRWHHVSSGAFFVRQEELRVPWPRRWILLSELGTLPQELSVQSDGPEEHQVVRRKRQTMNLRLTLTLMNPSSRALCCSVFPLLIRQSELFWNVKRGDLIERFIINFSVLLLIKRQFGNIARLTENRRFFSFSVWCTT